MARLRSRTPFEGLLPITIGTVLVEEVVPGPVHLVATFAGQEAGVGRALGTGLSLAFPAPGQVTEGRDARAIWVAPGQALVFAADLPAIAHAAVTDQSDAFAICAVSGPDAAELLSRLVPVDLRPSAFPTGTTARTLVGHMTASVTAVENGIEIMVFRSMAGTLAEELSHAARHLAARRA
ncbi:sarcosine oxidase subunit gamma [Pelagovum pacificum]|uniref:Sarcosine oxidase subunit gamma n=1 Tax=Pelagovum pacificum TaxID=2588711 RepID=A0A5C5GFT9_9RHOB|nr:sarcosine oxidase subunit gamma [Pelagovum pacificum]QQA43787.1 sarcosine oxidase subunit gamma [Pelagovum pacificum]TNY33084.1 sarcosine oxidase subunit gamma [Pelagovum pacificum]